MARLEPAVLKAHEPLIGLGILEASDGEPRCLGTNMAIRGPKRKGHEASRCNRFPTNRSMPSTIYHAKSREGRLIRTRRASIVAKEDGTETESRG